MDMNQQCRLEALYHICRIVQSSKYIFQMDLSNIFHPHIWQSTVTWTSEKMSMIGHANDLKVSLQVEVWESDTLPQYISGQSSAPKTWGFAGGSCRGMNKKWRVLD